MDVPYEHDCPELLGKSQGSHVFEARLVDNQFHAVGRSVFHDHVVWQKVSLGEQGKDAQDCLDFGGSRDDEVMDGPGWGAIRVDMHQLAS
ncbi:hypothetical protein ACMAUO_04850 [Gluconacetobacter sp. Hr-1-5]|uniref:hypothetical protein n=1 Tax=Gluconacetobacter sp. Hr-1-5 TaxID=3395370 RepID=UPI003B52A4C1